MFNGKYFIQKVDITNKEITDKFDASESYWNNETNQIKYQIAEGSSIDQMLAQWHANILGLGEIFDKEQRACALSEMMKNNFKPTMRDFVNHWRVFAINDEAGTVICDYPEEVEELARMLGGVEITEKVLENAQEMKNQAHDLKARNCQ